MIFYRYSYHFFHPLVIIRSQLLFFMVTDTLTLIVLKYVDKYHRYQRVIHFNIIIDVLVSSFRFIKQPSLRQAAYSIPHDPPQPQLFVFKLLIYQFLLPHTSHSHHTLLGNCFDPHITNPLITMFTNEKILISAFQEKVFIRYSFNLANMLSYVSQWPDYLLVGNL